MGDLPVPPTERLPTQMRGRPNEVDGKYSYRIHPVTDKNDQPEKWQKEAEEPERF
jgi:hypothetical protein